MRRIHLTLPLLGSALLLLPGTSLSAQAPDKDLLIQSALAAAPANIAKDAAVVAAGPDGKMMQLKPGTNGFTCLPDHPTTPGKDPMCVDQQGMVFLESWIARDPKPKNTSPGLGYMLQGGSDISATDPWVEPGPGHKFVDSPPHWMIFWPYDAKATGFSTTPKQDGTWIMWAGTPYAHLMINQAP